MRKSGYRYYNDIRDLRFFVFITTFQPILKGEGFRCLSEKIVKHMISKTSWVKESQTFTIS